MGSCIRAFDRSVILNDLERLTGRYFVLFHRIWLLLPEVTPMRFATTNVAYREFFIWQCIICDDDDDVQ